MIEPTWVRAMAAYNSEMNRRTYAAADTLSDEERRADRGAFFGGIHATLNHLVWGDRIWMSRFDGWEAPAVSIPGSTTLHADWDELSSVRRELDARIEDWAAGLISDTLNQELVWFSRSTQRERRDPRWLAITHFFNHQTHHRGQVHALLTRAGVSTQDTDLTAVVRRDSWCRS
ncbi:MAG: DinB family protein [Rubritepida sp.]|nr:DinB family protein [Rubritepida sp.]